MLELSVNGGVREKIFQCKRGLIFSDGMRDSCKIDDEMRDIKRKFTRYLSDAESCDSDRAGSSRTGCGIEAKMVAGCLCWTGRPSKKRVADFSRNIKIITKNSEGKFQ